MKRAALTAALLAALSSTALAGVYVGLGIGTNEATEGNADRLVDSGRSYRLLAGYQFRPLQLGTRTATVAVEGSLGGYGLGLLDRTSVVGIDARQFSLAGRVNVPLSNNFQAFGRVGLHHTSATAENSIYDTAGNGYLVGLGLEYRFNARIGTGASVGIDYQLNKVELSGERFQNGTAFDVLERQWTLGVTLGF
ncbi:MAG TPA: outer membrane beta-barrel protein [Kofleriaceae bacterium]|nr:outer membrane beta-barrel protein [Kofleriaceae bacterium]